MQNLEDNNILQVFLLFKYQAKNKVIHCLGREILVFVNIKVKVLSLFLFCRSWESSS